jgi:hypothetical protein
MKMSFLPSEEDMENWKSENNPGKQTALAVVCTGAGLTLMAGFHNFDGPGMTNSKAGFFLGLLLFFIGAAGFLARGRQTVVVDPVARQITIDDKTFFGTKRRSIRFHDIVGISVGFLGKKSNYVTYYYLALKLRNGEEYPLFAPGRFYDGASDRSAVEGWRTRLEKYLRP